MPKGRTTSLKSRVGDAPGRTKTVNTNSWLGVENRHKNFYGTYRWKQERARFLQKHPLCAHCSEKKRVTPANTVDHKEPHRGDERLFWCWDNWQPLCQACHSIKTASESGAFGNPSA